MILTEPMLFYMTLTIQMSLSTNILVSLQVIIKVNDELFNQFDSSGGKRIQDCDEMVKEIIPRHLSMFALDPRGKPIGVAINNACSRSEMEVPAEQVTSMAINVSVLHT